VAQLLGHLPTKCKGLSPNPSTARTEQNKTTTTTTKHVPWTLVYLAKFYHTNLPKVVPPAFSHSDPFLETEIHYMLVLLTLQGSFDISSHFLPLSKYGKTSNHKC
jgi:hypothetical protein